MNNILLNKTMYLIIVAITIILVYFSAIKMVFIFLPFLIGIFISKLIIPAVNFLHDKLKLPNNLSTAICILFVIGVSGYAIYEFVLFISGYLVMFSNIIPSWTSEIIDYSGKLQEQYKDLILSLPIDITGTVSKGVTTLLNYVGSFAGFLGSAALSLISNLPGLLITVIITMLSAFFFTKDRMVIENMIDPWKRKYFTENSYYLNFKKDVLSVIIGYIKAQAILMTITFTICAIGLSIIGVEHALPIALGIGFVDALPIFGPASVYMPWIIYQLIIGKSSLALQLFILYLVTTITRQICEPKVVGEQIGMHPLVTLSALYVGVRILGAPGLIIGPLTAVTCIASWRRYGTKKL